MNLKKSTILIVVIVIVSLISACNRSKSSTADTPQVTSETSSSQAIPESDFTFFDGTITDYSGTATALVIPAEIQGQGVDSISGLENKNLTSITLPNSVQTIIGQALNGNPLGSITIGADVTFGSPVFDNGFVYTYDEGGKQAGTYIRQNGEWTKQ